MEQKYLFTTAEGNQQSIAATRAEDGCVYPGCGKVRAADLVHCPHHADFVAWKAGESERKRKRRNELKEMRRLKADLLAVSPLRAMNTQFTEPQQQKQRAKRRTTKRSRIPA
jgi:hypothetical protein